MKEQPKYQDLKQRLDEIIASLQDEELDIDAAIKLHTEGQKVIASLDAYLVAATADFEKSKAKLQKQ